MFLRVQQNSMSFATATLLSLHLIDRQFKPPAAGIWQLTPVHLNMCAACRVCAWDTLCVRFKRFCAGRTTCPLLLNKTQLTPSAGAASYSNRKKGKLGRLQLLAADCCLGGCYHNVGPRAGGAFVLVQLTQLCALSRSPPAPPPNTVRTAYQADAILSR